MISSIGHESHVVLAHHAIAFQEQLGELTGQPPARRTLALVIDRVFHPLGRGEIADVSIPRIRCRLHT
ncbi:hypothetical protein [Kibdelosporangium aridum]|uniref:hypothetical protein n=1 Tax=Kibdelosporangium aridum TaxID=2030 RepID=UPI000A7D98FA|nr:hypothetical protein [Kibdelosporangium aridum]